jgi:uncharacterized membrane protein
MSVGELRFWVLGMNLAAAVVVAALAVPMIRRRVPMNHFYGARFPKSFESDDLWYRINEHAGRVLLRWAAVVAATGIAALFVWDHRVLTALGFAPTLYLIGAVESYLFSRKL